MLQSIVHGALKHRLILVVVAIALLGFGVNAARHLSVDAFPDVTNIQVQIATEAPGKSPEEVERFITIPVEIAMTGLPGMTDMRSMNKPGLSLITLVFEDGRNLYLERQMVSERLSELRDRMPEGVTPVLGPITNALGEVYQYTLERPDDGQRPLSRDELIERRTVQDWVVRPLLRSISGVAEINSTGGYVKQYETLVDPQKLRYYNLTIQDVRNALAHNNANAGGGILPQHAEQYLIRSVGLVRDLDDIRGIVLKESGATPIYIRDVANVRFGTELIRRIVQQAGFESFNENTTMREGVTGFSAASSVPDVEGFNNALVPAGTNPTTVSNGSRTAAGCAPVTDTSCVNGSDVLILRYQGLSKASASGPVPQGTVINCAGLPVGDTTVAANRPMSSFHVRRSASGEPTLTCTYVDSGGTVQDRELIEGVETFQVLYGVDSVTPGAATASSAPEPTVITRYLRADQMVVAGSTTATQNNWRRVRAVRIGMIMRGPVGSAIDRATQTLYPLGIKLVGADDSFSTFVAPADGRLRQEVTFTVHMRNYLGQGV